MYSVPPVNFIYCSYKITVRFADQIGNKSDCRGTGFFVATDDGNVAFVTNRHVLDPKYKKLNVHDSMKLVELVILGKTRQGETFELFLDPSQIPVFPKNFEDDIACIINPQDISNSLNAVVFHHFGIEALANEHYVSEEIQPGEQVFYAGFPDPHDKLAQRPILRSGTIASDPKYSYSYTGIDEGERIAYEAFSSGGASGSPVWAAGRSFKGYPGSRTGAIVGINGGHIVEKFGAHSGISFFYKSSVLLEMLQSAGITANPSEPAQSPAPSSQPTTPH